MPLLILSRRDLQGLFDLPALLTALADSLKALSLGTAVAPRRTLVSVPNRGFMLAMPAWQPQAHLSIKVVNVFEGNHQLGLPSHQALITLFDSATGAPLAVMEGAYLTAMRTAGVAALSAQMLARPEARTLAIIGAGVQGQAHLQLVSQIRNFSVIKVASRHLAHAQALATTLPNAQAASSAEDAVRGAEVVCLCTSANEPVIEVEWIMPGTHIVSVGYVSTGGELPRALIERGRLFVETRLAFEPPPAGSSELIGVEAARGTELGEVLLGQRPGRQSASELTLYKSMGHAIEDLAIANLMYQQAQAQGVGTWVDI